jgi:Flp pilus assembly protein TadG
MCFRVVGATSSSRLRGSRGEVIGAVILLPVVVTMVFLVIQAALVFHARSIVAAAAEDAARAAQMEQGTAADGRAVAQSILAGSAGLIPAPTVTIERSATSVSVTVSATVRGPIPWLHPTVTAGAGGPVERFVPESER